MHAVKFLFSISYREPASGLSYHTAKINGSGSKHRTIQQNQHITSKQNANLMHALGASIALQNSPAGNNQHDETIPDLQWPSLHTVSKRPLVTAKQLGMVAPPATSYDSYYNAG